MDMITYAAGQPRDQLLPQMPTGPDQKLQSFADISALNDMQSFLADDAPVTESAWATQSNNIVNVALGVDDELVHTNFNLLVALKLPGTVKSSIPMNELPSYMITLVGHLLTIRDEQQRSRKENEAFTRIDVASNMAGEVEKKKEKADRGKSIIAKSSARAISDDADDDGYDEGLGRQRNAKRHNEERDDDDFFDNNNDAITNKKTKTVIVPNELYHSSSSSSKKGSKASTVRATPSTNSTATQPANVPFKPRGDGGSTLSDLLAGASQALAGLQNQPPVGSGNSNLSFAEQKELKSLDLEIAKENNKNKQ